MTKSKSKEGDLHVIPQNDLREHVSTAECWCNPTPSDDDSSVWVHHSMDRREEYEPDGEQRRKPH